MGIESIVLHTGLLLPHALASQQPGAVTSFTDGQEEAQREKDDRPEFTLSLSGRAQFWTRATDSESGTLWMAQAPEKEGHAHLKEEPREDELHQVSI